MEIDFNFETKSKIAEAIYQAEIDTDHYGGSIGTSLLSYADTIKELEPKKITFAQKIKNIANRILKGEKKERIYAQYLEKDILFILKEASKEGVTSGHIIKEYRPIKKMADDVRRKIRSKLLIPIVISLGSIGMMDYVVSQFLDIMNDGTLMGDFELARTIGENYIYIGIALTAALAVPLIVFPHKVPKLKNIFIKTDAMMAVLLVKILNDIGHSPITIIPFLQQSFSLNIPVLEKDIKGLVKLLYKAKYISIFQAAKLMKPKSLKRDFPILLGDTLGSIKQDVELSADIINDAVGNLSTFLILLPVAPAVYVMGVVIRAILAQSGL